MELQVLSILLSLLGLFTEFGLPQNAESCAIAALSGSTSESFAEIVKAGGGTLPKGTSPSAGKECITKYYKQLGLKSPGGGLSRFSTTTEWPGLLTKESKLDTERQMTSRSVSLLEARQGCKPNILVFARGTTEPGTMGMTVGPALSSALNRRGAGKWSSQGVKYTADIAGDNCIGFPGGIKCVDQLAKLAARCPQSSFFLSGYSQGAMVARICTAYSKDDVKKKIKGVVVFGDPFNGASIKGFPSENIKTYCASGDGVCQGKFVITAAHLGYTGGTSISGAAKWMNDHA